VRLTVLPRIARRRGQRILITSTIRWEGKVRTETEVCNPIKALTGTVGRVRAAIIRRTPIRTEMHLATRMRLVPIEVTSKNTRNYGMGIFGCEELPLRT
jgi:hypothetical protein